MIQNKKGSVLIFSLIVLSFIMVSALGIAASTLVDRKASIVTSNSTSSLQLADTGIEFFLQQIYQNVDQDGTLHDLAGQIGGTCTSTTTEGVKINVTVGDRDDDRQSFTLIPKGESALVNPSGTLDVSEIPHCDYPLATVSTIKAIGNNKNTARALEIDLADSLERGLLARWAFEDNATAVNFDSNFPGAPLATDGSVYNHAMTLCPADQEAQEFNGCECQDSVENQEAACADDFNGSDEIGFPHGSTDDGDDSNNAWTAGIVNERGEQLFNEDGSAVGTLHSQALHFDASNFHYLMMNPDSDLDQENLELDKDDSFSFSAWFKTDQAGTILSRMNNGGDFRGYDFILNGNGQAVLHMIRTWPTNALSVRTDLGDLRDSRWHHVVATYDGSSSENGVELYIDGDGPVATDNNGSENVTGDTLEDNVPFHIGRRYFKDNDATFEGSLYFDGELDDIRVYDRVLAPFEVAQLCRHGDGGSFPDTCPNPATLVSP